MRAARHQDECAERQLILIRRASTRYPGNTWSGLEAPAWQDLTATAAILHFIQNPYETGGVREQYTSGLISFKAFRNVRTQPASCLDRRRSAHRVHSCHQLAGDLSRPAARCVS